MASKKLPCEFPGLRPEDVALKWVAGGHGRPPRDRGWGGGDEEVPEDDMDALAEARGASGPDDGDEDDAMDVLAEHRARWECEAGLHCYVAACL